MVYNTSKTDLNIDLVDNPNEPLVKSQIKLSQNFQLINDLIKSKASKSELNLLSSSVSQSLIEMGDSLDSSIIGINNTLNSSIIGINNTTVKLTGDQTIKDVKTFNSDIVGNITGKASLNLPLTGGTMTGAITAIRETQISLGVSSAIDLSLGNLFTKSINSSTTFSVLNCLSSGTSNSFILELVNAGAFTIKWFSGIKWAEGFAPILTASGVDVLGFYSYDGGVTWKGLVLGNDMK